MQVMSEANDSPAELPPVSGAERGMAVLGLLAAIVIGVVCLDLIFGGAITGAAAQAVNDLEPGGGCVDC
jgi:type IV secretory pathway TrbD component